MIPTTSLLPKRIASSRSLLLVLAGLACTRPDLGSAGGSPASAFDAVVLRRAAIAIPGVKGVSGLTHDEQGAVWAMPERIRGLVRLGVGEEALSGRGQLLTLLNIPKYLDTESMAWLEGNRLAVGTETQLPRSQDFVLVVRVDEHNATLVESIPLPYRLWGIRAEANQGIEGLCQVGGVLVAGVETVIRTDGARFAPVARYDRATKSWTPFRVRLTSAKGKLSSLDCRAALDSDSIEVLMVERHYGVVRLLRFSLPAQGGNADLVPELVVDFADLIPERPNIEGVVWHGPDQILLAVDNDTGGVRGPNGLVLLRVRARSAPGARE